MKVPSEVTHQFHRTIENTFAPSVPQKFENFEDMEAGPAFAIEDASVLARMLEIERLRNAQLDGMRQMRTHLHINLAHELRTPLAAVRGYTRMVLEGRAGDVTELQREYLTIVNENTNRMIHLVNWMSRVFDIGEQEMRLEVVDFLRVWSECFSSHEAALLQKSIDIALEVSREQFTGLADRNQICRIFDQILSAAIRFSDQNAQLSVTFSHGREQETTVRIAGISREVPGDHTDQIDRSVANICDAVGVHGGRFFVRRSPEEGTVLLATLPAIRYDFH